MPLYAFDGASAFDLDAAKRAGGIVCTTYIRGTPGGFNHADAARVAAIRARGMGASPNWESTADYFGTCSMSDAQWAGTDALRACRELGYPDDGSIACSFSFDFDVPTARFAEMGQKVRAITTGLAGHYLTMIYGQQALIDYLAAHGYITGRHWLMMSTFNQPYNPASANVCMVQEHDVNGNWITSPVAGTDINTVTDPAAVKAWWPPNSPYGGDDMPLTDADVKKIWDYGIANYKAQDRLKAISDNAATNQTAIMAKVQSPDVIARAVVAALPPASTGGMTAADIEKAVKNVLDGATITTQGA